MLGFFSIFFFLHLSLKYCVCFKETHLRCSGGGSQSCHQPHVCCLCSSVVHSLSIVISEKMCDAVTECIQLLHRKFVYIIKQANSKHVFVFPKSNPLHCMNLRSRPHQRMLDFYHCICVNSDMSFKL